MVLHATLLCQYWKRVFTTVTLDYFASTFKFWQVKLNFHKFVLRMIKCVFIKSFNCIQFLFVKNTFYHFQDQFFDVFFGNLKRLAELANLTVLPIEIYSHNVWFYQLLHLHFSLPEHFERKYIWSNWRWKSENPLFTWWRQILLIFNFTSYLMANASHRMIHMFWFRNSHNLSTVSVSFFFAQLYLYIITSFAPTSVQIFLRMDKNWEKHGDLNWPTWKMQENANKNQEHPPFEGVLTKSKINFNTQFFYR